MNFALWNNSQSAAFEAMIKLVLSLLCLSRLTLILSCSMNFHLYPHDTQQCAMKIESRKWLFFFFFQGDSVSTPIFHGSEFSYSFVFVRPSCKSGDVSLQTRRAAPPFPTCSRISTSHWVNWKAVFHFFSFCAGEIKFLRERGKSCWGRVVYFFLPLLFLSVGVRVSTEVVNNNDWRVCDVFALLSILLFLLLLLLLCFP